MAKKSDGVILAPFGGQFLPRINSTCRLQTILKSGSPAQIIFLTELVYLDFTDVRVLFSGKSRLGMDCGWLRLVTHLCIGYRTEQSPLTSSDAQKAALQMSELLFTLQTITVVPLPCFFLVPTVIYSPASIVIHHCTGYFGPRSGFLKT